MCGSRKLDGSLQALRPKMYVDPHRWHATMPWKGNRSLVISYAVKPIWKLEASDRAWLREYGFVLPKTEVPHPALSLCEMSSMKSPLRMELEASEHLLGSSQLTNLASDATAACQSAYRKAEEAAWSVYQDSLLTYGQSLEPQLDVLEVYAGSDSRLTTWINSMGGRAMRFTASDGDLTTPQGQRVLWDLLQKTQPRHVWCAPDCKHWSPWSHLNSARSPKHRESLTQQRHQDQVHWKLCSRICEWQCKQEGIFT